MYPFLFSPQYPANYIFLQLDSIRDSVCSRHHKSIEVWQKHLPCLLILLIYFRIIAKRAVGLAFNESKSFHAINRPVTFMVPQVHIQLIEKLRIT